MRKMLHVQMDDDNGNRGFWVYSTQHKRAIKRFNDEVEKLKKRDIRGRIILGASNGTTIEEYWHKQEPNP